MSLFKKKSESFINPSKSLACCGCGTDNGYTYNEIPVSALRMTSLNADPLQLLAPAGDGKYYDYYGYLEYNKGTGVLSYDTFAKRLNIYGDNSGTIFNIPDLSFRFDYSWKFSSENTTRYDPWENIIPDRIITDGEYLNSGLYLSVSHLINPFNGELTGGDGTFLIKLWHKKMTFGSLL